MKKAEGGDSLTIGCDPEFALMKDGHSIYFEEGNDFIGDDSGLAEIRPMYSKDPLVVVKNIKKCMNEGVILSPDLLNYRWRAGSYDGNESGGIGGHIHFGGFLKGELLDWYLAPVGLALEAPREALNRRLDGVYGQLGNIRTEDGRTEYRTLSSWLTSPAVARGVLCIAKVVGQAIVNKELTMKPETVLTNVDIGAMRSLKASIYKHKFDLEKIRSVAMSIRPTIESLPLYPTYERHIKFLFNLIKARKTWFPMGKDMKAAWGVTATKEAEKFAFYA